MRDFKDQLPEKAQEYFELVRSGAQQMSVLIEEILAFSKLSRRELKKQPVQPALLVEQALNLLQFDRADRKIDISIGELPPCEADPVLLQQVYVNLLSNAFKFSRNRPVARVEIGFQNMETGDGAYFVRDNGAGFDMAYADKLFGVFQRFHTAQEFEGTGIGLANVQRIIQKHGGRIWAEAAVDKGAVFYFTVGPHDGDLDALTKKSTQC